MIDKQQLKTALDAVLERGVRAGDVPGVTAAVTTPDATLYEAAFGERALGGGDPMTPDTIFRVASLTKAVTAVGVMQQVERGRLDLDAPAGEVVPYLGEVQVLAGFDDAGQPMLRPPATPVTLRHLLTHTSGFSYDTWSVAHRRFADATGFSAPGRASLRTPLMFDPGTGWQYGTGYDWACQLVEAVTGQRFGAYLEDNLFGPLGMSAGWTVPAAQWGRVARIHQRRADGGLAVDPADPPHTVAYEAGGGGIHTTAGDYLKFIRMILNRGTGNGARVLSEASVARLADPDAGAGNIVTPLVTTNPSRSNAGGFFPEVRKRHSLGFVINEEAAPTGRSPGSLAWAGVFNCYYWIDPKKGIGGVYMTQIAPFLDARALPLFLDFETATYASVG